MPIAWRLSGVRAASQHYIARSMTVTPFVDFGSRSKSGPSRRGLALPKPVIHSSLSSGLFDRTFRRKAARKEGERRMNQHDLMVSVLTAAGGESIESHTRRSEEHTSERQS